MLIVALALPKVTLDRHLGCVTNSLSLDFRLTSLMSSSLPWPLFWPPGKLMLVQVPFQILNT